MSYIDFMPLQGKKNAKNHTELLQTSRNESRARKALHDMIEFQDSIDASTQAMLTAASQGLPVDKELLAKLVTVKEKYLIAMQGMENYDDQQEHLALVIYADAVQDVIRHMNRLKKH